MNKSAIRAQFKALLNRNDCTNALADTFIDQGLSRIERTLRIPAMERVVSVSFPEAMPDWFMLPDDFLELIDLYHESDTGGNKLSVLPRAKFLGFPKCAGIPKHYIRTGSSIQVKPIPTPGLELTLIYYAEFPEFQEDTDEITLSSFCPELIIYSALSYASDYFVDDRKDAFEAVYTRIYNELEEQAREMEFAGSDMAVQSIYQNADY